MKIVQTSPHLGHYQVIDYNEETDIQEPWRRYLVGLGAALGLVAGLFLLSSSQHRLHMPHVTAALFLL